MRQDYAARARVFVGTRFRAQGRSARTGLDCAGLVIATFGIVDAEIRRNYRLRGDHRKELETNLSRYFRSIDPSQLRSGDVLMMDVASDQQHLAVWTIDGFVHADACLGLVVETPGLPKWTIVGAFRRRTRALREA